MTSRLEQIGRELGTFFNASELMRQDFPEPKWAVPGLVAEGLNLLVGAPKLGKSFLCLGLAVAVASGGQALGTIPVKRGAVLYAALEDGGRRLQNRLSTILQGEAVPEGLDFATALPRMPEATGFIEGWIEGHPDARLVIIDVLRKVRPLADGRGNAYNEDYDTLGALKALADRHGIAFVVVHHTRKMADDADVFNEVSGSTGLTGAADAILVAKRARNTADAVLSVTGRDITEHEYGLSWSKESCTWSLLSEPVAVAEMSEVQRKIHRHLEAVTGDTPKRIAEATGLTVGTVKGTLSRMLGKGQVDTDGNGHYFTQPVTHVTRNPVTHVTQAADPEPAQPEIDPETGPDRVTGVTGLRVTPAPRDVTGADPAPRPERTQQTQQDGGTCSQCTSRRVVLSTSVELEQGVCRLHLRGAARERDADERGQRRAAERRLRAVGE